MYYTILTKSNWVGDSWKVYQMTVDKKEAQELADLARDNDDHARVTIKAHRKPLSLLSSYENWTVKFSDGTTAVLPPL